jgi:hypothetical protein
MRGHWVFTAAALVWGIFCAITQIRDNFFSPPLQPEYATLNVLPNWPWHVWVIGFLVILLIMMFEGAFHAYSENAQAAPTSGGPPLAAPSLGSSGSSISISVSPTISPTIAPQITQRADLPAHRPPPETPRPNLLFLGAKVARIQFSATPEGGQMFVESDSPGKCLAIIACFRNEPSTSQRVCSGDYVRAQVIYRDQQRMEIDNGVFAACWLRHHADMIDFDVGQSHCVLLGFVDGGKLVVPWKRRQRTWEGDMITLEDCTFDGVSSLEIRLIGENNDLLLDPVVLDFPIANGEPCVIKRN